MGLMLVPFDREGACRYGNPRQTLCAALVALALSASPEVVRAYNLGIFRNFFKYASVPGKLQRELLEQTFELKVLHLFESQGEMGVVVMELPWV